MDNLREVILYNICYMELVYGRINKKLGLNKEKNDIEQMIVEIIANLDSRIEKKEKFLCYFER